MISCVLSFPQVLHRTLADLELGGNLVCHWGLDSSLVAHILCITQCLCVVWSDLIGRNCDPLCERCIGILVAWRIVEYACVLS